MDAKNFVHAIYREEREAVQAAEALIAAQFPAGDIGAFKRAPDSSAEEEIPIKHMTGLPLGSAVGGVLGVVGGSLVASGFLVGAVPIVLALEGAVAGGAFGAFVGALGGLAHWQKTIRFPAHTFESGGVLLGVTVHAARVDEARNTLASTGGQEIEISSKQDASIAAQGGSHA